MRLDPATPFVLLDDARDDGVPARLYRRPSGIVRADGPDGVAPLFEKLAGAGRHGLHAAGFCSYGLGTVLEPRAGIPESGPLAWFGLFESYRTVAPGDIAALLPDPAGAWVGEAEPEITQSEYEARVARIAEWIAAGDIYQANFTFRATVRAAGDPLALYAAIRKRARAGFGAIVATGEDLILSFSPELFFALADGRLTARPMKGTAARGPTPALDAASRDALHRDPKQRAENLMILDLMRNDLGRIARPGSVQVPERFVVETYPTVHQMVSAVTADLGPGLGAVDALRALFPCGSITGAPKIRAMQIIGATETSPRGVYTGAIGRIDANGDAMFNVAIRTLARTGDGRYVLGLGSGLVADSVPAGEWRECLAKGAFLTTGQPRFDLIETMPFDPEEGILRLKRHLARLKESAAAFGFRFDRHDARNELQAATFRLRERVRIRLLLAAHGATAIEVTPMPPPLPRPVRVAPMPLPVDPADFRLRHKTTNRAFYDEARRRSGADEVVFVTPDGAVTEGSFSSVFVERDGTLVTPPLSAGLLPGILRGELIDTGRAVEGRVTPEDLTQDFYVGNALRGLNIARLVAPAAIPG
ncbi:aminodeoxychorismate synthase component I [Stakelama saccharophila]|uniref:Probable branched-chain-amino-acid aminotransferase n=1 Tax=Stakelama saccharophila TaxID=3075605 RepID=A0ABZ0BAU8_9SPHN|nr:aminodeoxychorismate synthase component I [Stakelama sp. W311]WNO53978.1 aminodeoxychorismate synthase component I [Stakelama sp. W311]